MPIKQQIARPNLHHNKTGPDFTHMYTFDTRESEITENELLIQKNNDSIKTNCR